MDIRVLTADDAAAYRELRLCALQLDPDAFLTSYEEYVGRSVEDIARQLSPTDYHFTLGAFDGTSRDGTSRQLVGTVTLVRQQRLKVAHIAEVVAMFVVPEFRRRGIGRLLLEELVNRARMLEDVVQLQLIVIKGNDAAIHLYESVGFRTYATFPRSVRIADSFRDEFLMVLFLDGEPRDIPIHDELELTKDLKS
ncbi:MAG: GNAT family N-acetyltransferase [Alicyclobacillus sp.]|nr:GNAT family N-acetyltransferase [Alicyclobacillus sp.]